jgi:hypothetical protein
MLHLTYVSFCLYDIASSDAYEFLNPEISYLLFPRYIFHYNQYMEYVVANCLALILLFLFYLDLGPACYQ